MNEKAARELLDILEILSGIADSNYLKAIKGNRFAVLPMESISKKVKRLRAELFETKYKGDGV